MRTATLALLVLGLCLRIALALRPLVYLDGLTIPDDTYLSLTIARNLGRGLGPLYGDAPTSGFQPLLVLLLAPIFAWFPNAIEGPVHADLIFLSICDALAALMLCRLSRRVTDREYAPLLVAAVWCLNPYIVSITLGGLETALSAFLAAAAFAMLPSVSESRSAPRHFWLGVVVGLAILARIDNVFLAAIVACFLAAREWVGLHPSISASLRRIAPLALGIGIVVLPWLAYSYSVTGDLYPISGRAVRFQAATATPYTGDPLRMHLYLLSIAARVLWECHRIALVTLATMFVVALVVIARKRSRFPDLGAALRPVAPVLSYGILISLAYPLHIYAFWFFPRYLFPVTIAILLSVGLLGDFLLMKVPAGRERRLAAGGLAVVLVFLYGSRSELSLLAFSEDTHSQGYMNLGLWAARRLPPGTAIGSSQTGALSYFATNLRVVNLDGVVNRACFDSLVAGRNIDYILDARLDYVVGWRANIAFIHRWSNRPVEPILQPLGIIRGFRSWGHEWYLYRVRRENVSR